MPDPVDTLGLLVEAGVAIAGFSGVVVVFGRRGEREWSVLERNRLENLLATSLTVVLLALIALAVLHAGTTPTTTWRIGSAIWAIAATFEIAINARRAAQARREDPAFPRGAWTVALLGLSGLLVLLSVANVLVIRDFWPFVAALIWLFALSVYTFARLLFMVGRGNPAA